MTIFDIETDGLLDKVSKIHCLSYYDYNTGKKGSFINYTEIKDFIKNCKTIIGHNIIRYDIPVLEKILDIKINCNIIDTLGLSWYLYPNRKKHGLEWWGIDFGIEKPKIDDWENLTIEEYIYRCEEDVKINSQLFNIQYNYLRELYEDPKNFINYINFKLTCLKEQEEVGIHLDLNLCVKIKQDLEIKYKEKVNNLSVCMPKTVLKNIPKILYKKDGSLSINGEKWIQELKDRNLPLNSICIYTSGEPTNTQLKNWLFELGWKPRTYKLSKNTGKMVEQISLPFGQGICDSIKDMYEDFPILKELDNLFLIKHRIGVLKSFIECNKNGRIFATAHGFTNTLRFTHSVPCVNLPSVIKPYGKEIRGCLSIPNEDYIMCGSDVSGLEDNTKQHYIYFFDPQYVNDMRVPGFDPHLDIALLANMITQEEDVFFKEKSKEENLTPEDSKKLKSLKKIRGDAKVVNFSATYGAGPPKIADTLRCDLKFAKILHTTYWERNKAVKQTAKAVKIKEVEKQKWLYNPISKFWYFLKADKDKFSTLNQGKQNCPV